MKELKWKHNKCAGVNDVGPCKKCCGYDCKSNEVLTEILTPYPKKRNWFERFLNRYNHVMEFIRTVFALTTIILQLFILSKLI